MDPSRAIGDVELWLERVVIGHGLCPFAKRPADQGLVHIVAATRSLYDETLDQLEELLELPAHLRATTLVVGTYPLGFEDFLDDLDAVDHLLADSGAQALVQTASFHPAYRFEGTRSEAASNYTNRAPWPVLQLLRTHDVARAVGQMPDASSIPTRNIAHFESLGLPALRQLWSELFGQRAHH